MRRGGRLGYWWRIALVLLVARGRDVRGLILRRIEAVLLLLLLTMRGGGGTDGIAGAVVASAEVRQGRALVM